MFVERAGSGPRTFFGLHGWSGDHRTFAPLMANLPDDVTFFSADLPGCGKSEPPRHWTLACIADSVAEAIWKLPAPVTLVGNCSGALLGIEAAQRLGNRVERLVLIDLFAVFPWYFRVFISKPIGRMAYATTFQNPLGRWFTNLSLRAKRKQDTNLTGGFAGVDHNITYRYLQLFDKFPQPETFAGLTQAVELLYGEKTFAAVRESVPRWKSVWPQASSICLAGAGHLPIQEATAQMRDNLIQPKSVQPKSERRHMSGNLDRLRELVESGLQEWVPAGHLLAGARLNEAIQYAIFPGGKRMRPVLSLLAAQVANCSAAEALPAACATEFLHASSLIFDDLPAMDDADVRRGRPALHLRFGEDTALLTALALLNQAYSLFGSTPALLREAVECIGVNGMIGGQAADLAIRAAGNGNHRGRESRNRKTTGLMRLTLTAGALACGARARDVKALAHCGECLGEAYQTYDDLLDEFGGCEQTGKTARQDARHHRASHVAEFGIEASREHVEALTDEAKGCLCSHFGVTEPVAILLGAIDKVMGRTSAAGLVSA